MPLGALSAAALLLHAVALGGLDWAWPTTESPRLPNSAMQVRAVDVSPEPLPAAAWAPPPRVAVDEPPAPPAPVVRARPRPGATRVPAVPTVAAPAVRLAATPQPASVAAPSTPDDEAIPHYRTRMPPAATLRYDVRRGLLHGMGELAWRPQGDHYELQLDFRLSGLTILSQGSSGGFDAAGVAPLRFTDQRPRRAMTAANFQRAADKISYSGSAREFPLRPGAQDRLSWMVQLAAIVAADPQLARPDAKVAMLVTGSHADASVWVFRCVGPEAVATRAGSIDAIKFVREAREPYDTTVQVWLDPAQHDLPVRATQRSGPDDDGYELRLLELLPGN